MAAPSLGRLVKRNAEIEELIKIQIAVLKIDVVYGGSLMANRGEEYKKKCQMFIDSTSENFTKFKDEMENFCNNQPDTVDDKEKFKSSLKQLESKLSSMVDQFEIIGNNFQSSMTNSLQKFSQIVGDYKNYLDTAAKYPTQMLGENLEEAAETLRKKRRDYRKSGSPMLKEISQASDQAKDNAATSIKEIRDALATFKTTMRNLGFETKESLEILGKFQENFDETVDRFVPGQ